MASIKFLPTTLAGPLWGKSPPHPRPNGLLVEAEISASNFTAIAFAHDDPTRFCVGDDSGAVFYFALRKNKFLVVARLVNGPVTSIDYISDKLLLVATGMTLQVVNVDTARVESKARGAHTNNVTRVATPAGTVAANIAATISSDTIMLWHTCPNLEARASKRATTPLADVQMTTAHIFTVESAGFVTKWDVDLNVVTRIDVSAFRPTTLSLYDTFLVVGCRTSNVLCLTPELEGISALNIPGTAGVVATSIIGGELFAAQCSDGTTWFVTSKDYGVSFSLSHPCPQPSVAFATGGATYAVITTKQRLFLYHVPTAKQSFDRLVSGLAVHDGNSASGARSIAAASTSSVSLASAIPFVRGPRDHAPTVPVEVAESSSVVIRKSVLSVPDPDNKDRPWVKVNLINNAEGQTGPGISRPIPLQDAVRGLHASVATNTSGGKKSQPPPPQQKGAKSTGSAATAAGAANLSKQRAAPPDASLDEYQSGEVTMRALLDHDSRVINMDKIRSMLMRYGVFPDRYRPLIWRFLLQLPDKRLAAPHFAVLASKGPHPSTPILMKPFPLPDNRLRLVFQRAMSALAWHAPAFSVAHFMPNIVFPFVKVFAGDIQSVIEVLLSFFLNWGQEYFTFYPHPPVSIISFLNHTLKSEDAPLWQHFDDHGIGADVWAWMPMQSVYTDVLTRNEWLQVMDHAFANEPLWLYLFHVSWLRHIRAPLLQLGDHATLVAMFRRCTPCNMNHIIRETYLLHNRCMRTELSAPYEAMRTFDEAAYPVMFECNESTITTKVQELEKIQKHEELVVTSQNRIAEVKKQLVQAAMLEDAFVGKQRALVAAKFDVENETWVQQVQLEREKQRLRDIEHETRLSAIQEQLRSAQRLEALQHEMQAAQANSRDANIDREKEMTKWDFADRMASHEVERLEQGARMKLAMMMATSGATTPLEGAAAAQQPPQQRSGFAPTSGETSANLSLTELGLGAAGQHQVHQQQSAPAPPPPRPQQLHSTLPTTTNVDDSSDHVPVPPTSRVAQVHQASAAATQTELPPPAPRSSSTPSTGGGSAAPPARTGLLPGFPGYAATTASAAGTTTTSTSMPSSSCDEDPIGYYQRVQREIQQRVEQAQEDQRRALAQLRSRYARTLTQPPSGSSAANDSSTYNSSVTEPECDDDDETLLETTDGNAAAGRATTAYTDDSSTVDSASMTRVMLRSQDDDAIFDLRRRAAGTNSGTRREVTLTGATSATSTTSDSA